MIKKILLIGVFATLIINVSCTNKEKELIIGSQWQTVGKNLSFPEGPAWDNNENLYVSNCNGNWLARIKNDLVDTLLMASDSTFGKTNGMIVDENGDLLACDFGFGRIIKINPQNKRLEILIFGYEGKRFVNPNDLVLTAEGNLYFTDPGKYDKAKTNGRVFYHDFKTGKTVKVAEGLGFANGIGISPLNSKKLYVCESTKDRILVYDINEDHTLANKTVFIDLPGGDPDGIDFDTQGNLYVAHYGSGTVFVISPNGDILQEVKTPGKNPSNLEFGGLDLKTLYLTEDETNAVYKIYVKIPGYKNHKKR